MADSNPLIQRINNQSAANINTVIDSVDSLRSLSKICRSLEKETLSQEAVEVINTQGGNVVNNLLNICSRTTDEIHKNTIVLQRAITENERTTNDPLTNELLQQQLQITTNISYDPLQATQQITEAMTISNKIKNRIEELEPNITAFVRRAAQNNSLYMKYAAGVFCLATAVIVACAAGPYLTPIVIGALKNVPATTSSGSIALSSLLTVMVKTKRK
ncbi:hypothetical protein I4U23_009854 [Adineta vaga]|nr:hypothetical protein I4U23_009854 [Adineta vaga]